MAHHHLLLLFLLFTSSALAKIPLTDFYPFGHNAHDLLVPPGDDTSTPRLPLQIGFPFFDVRHDALWVNVNGVVSFRRAISTYTPMCGRMSREYSMISPFWADIDLRADGGDLWYRESFEADILAKATTEVTAAFPEFTGNLNLRWAFIATWNNTRFFGCCDGCHPRNTFQIVLTTDGIRSWTIFNYHNIVWTTGTATGGDCTTGLGGVPAKAGFDAGDGKTFSTIPGSCSAEIATVDDRSNVNIPGKWIFRVDNSQIQTAGCSDNFNSALRIVPTFMNMYGHLPVMLIGPCYSPTSVLTCRFHDPIRGPVEVPGIGRGSAANQTVQCPVPFLYGGGRIRVNLLVQDGNVRQEYSGFLYVLSPEVAEKRLKVTNNGMIGDDQLSLGLTWNPIDFSGADDLTVHLFVYDRGSQPKWIQLGDVARNIPNSGSVSINLSQELLGPLLRKSLYLLSLQNSNKTSLFSVSADLASYFTDTRAACLSWYKSDPGPPRSVPACPPTTSLLIADDRFETDPSCDGTPTGTCERHLGADFCARSRNPNDFGSGAQCCYKRDRLFVDPVGGGTQDLSHYKKRVLGFGYHEHLLDDVLPWYLCCAEGEADLCQLYKEKRPIDTGSGYVPPRPAGGAGDPHITTFDGLAYTFNGAGEFWMIAANDSAEQPMTLQSRMEPFQNKRATVFTAFVMQCGNGSSSKVQIQKSTVRGVDIFVDGVVLELNNPILFDVAFQKVQLSISRDLSSILIAFACGFTFRVSVTSEALSILATADQQYFGRTRGLLGVYDADPRNDLQRPDGTVLPVSQVNDLEAVHYNFGLLWRVAQADSLFNYTDKSYSQINQPDYVPNFELPDPNQAPPEAIQLCGTSTECLYDYLTTGSASVANATLMAITKFNQTIEALEEANCIITCRPLEAPVHGFYRADCFQAGCVARFGCAPKYYLQGQAAIECDGEGYWNASMPICKRDGTSPPQGCPVRR